MGMVTSTLSKGLLGWSNEITCVKKNHTPSRVSVCHIMERASNHLSHSQHEVMLEGWERQGPVRELEKDSRELGQGGKGARPSAAFVLLPLF